MASVRYVHVSIDGFDTTDGSVDYDDPDSLKAGAGARIGTAFATGGATTELSLLGRVWNEFDGETEVTVDNGSTPSPTRTTSPGSMARSRDGAGHQRGRHAVRTSSSANGKFGDDFTSYGAKAGVRKGF